MSLRWRLALALGLLVAAAVLAVATITYASVSSQLRSETDDFLAERAAAVSRAAAVPDPGRFPGGPNGRWPREALFRLDVVAQLLGPNGEVQADTGPVTLPVDEQDRELAASQDREVRRRTATIEGTPYRIQTTSFGGQGALQLARDVTETERVLDRLQRRFLLVGAIVTALAALAGWLIARRTTAPLVRLTRAAEEVAATGELEHDLPSGGTNEVGRLSVAFRTMLQRLSRSREQQQQLVQDASHELRTPLTSLRTNVEVLRRHEELDAAARRPVLADLDAEARQLAALVDELVDLASDRRDGELVEDVELAAVVERAAERARRRTGRQVIVTTTTVDTSVHGGQAASTVRARAQALDRALANLLDNATKFSPPGTPVEVLVEGRRVSVRDHGAGIGPEDQGRVFDRFYRADAARSQPGSGLGLAIVRAVVEDHGGKVFATNHPGGGALVGFELPSNGQSG